VKRITGGRTVLHHLELTYAICADIDLFSDSILQTYKMISQPLSACLNRIGVPAEILPTRRRKSESSICFSEVSAYEIAVREKKIVGSAQFRKANRFLQHGSVLLDLDWDLWKAVWKLPTESTDLEDRITTVQQESKSKFDREGFIECFARNLIASLASDLYQEDFTADELARIAEESEGYRWSPAGLD
jgi:lipoate-protein ligase A